MTLVYLHGFNSAFDPDSLKFKELEKLKMPIVGISYDSFSKQSDILLEIQNKISSIDDDLAFIGTSLGGYYASSLAWHMCVPCILINPAIDPHESLQKHIGQSLENFKTRKVNVLDHETVSSYKGLPMETRGYEYRPLLLLDAGDECFDSKHTAEVFNAFETVMYEGGSHRFEHTADAVPQIKTYLNTCETVFQLNC